MNGNVPADDGMPAKPPDPFIVNPGGNAPLAIPKEGYGGAPPLAEKAEAYGTCRVPVDVGQPSTIGEGGGAGLDMEYVVEPTPPG